MLALPDSQWGRYGVKNFLPLPPQTSIVKPPQNYVIMSAFVFPTNPENLVEGLMASFYRAMLAQSAVMRQ